jgi:hypothetical protein
MHTCLLKLMGRTAAQRKGGTVEPKSITANALFKHEAEPPLEPGEWFRIWQPLLIFDRF